MYLRSRGSLINSTYYMMVRRERQAAGGRGLVALVTRDLSAEHCLGPPSGTSTVSGYFCAPPLCRQAGFSVRHPHAAAGSPSGQCCAYPAPVSPPSEPAGNRTGRAGRVAWGWRPREVEGQAWLRSPWSPADVAYGDATLVFRSVREDVQHYADSRSGKR